MEEKISDFRTQVFYDKLIPKSVYVTNIIIKILKYVVFILVIHICIMSHTHFHLNGMYGNIIYSRYKYLNCTITQDL